MWALSPRGPAPPWRRRCCPGRRARSRPRRAILARAARRRPISPTRISSHSIRLHPARTAEQRDPAAVDGRTLVRGAGRNSAGPLSRLERHPQHRQLRWIEDDGRVSVFRPPSSNSNGNTFDFQGRQLSCEHLTRRVVRYELDGSVTVLADWFQGKRLNSPNDVVPHPDGSYWFTDPPYGGQLYEGAPDAAVGRATRAARLNPRLGQPAGIGDRAPASCRPIATGSTRAAASTSSSPRIRSRTRTGCASPPISRSSMSPRPARGPGDTGPGGKGDIHVFDVGTRQQAVEPASCSATS